MQPVDTLEMAERALNSGGHLSGFTTGLEGLNTKIGGLHPSDLVILAGRPAMGKTALGPTSRSRRRRYPRDDREGIDPAKSAGAPARLFSLEMSADQLATRILAEGIRHHPRSLRGRGRSEDFDTFRAAPRRSPSLPLYIDDTPA